MNVTLVLPAVLDLKAAAQLKADLAGLRGQPATLDASAVQRLGGLCLQVLLAARKYWLESGHMLTISTRSEAFDEGLRLFGAAQMFDDGDAVPGAI